MVGLMGACSGGGDHRAGKSNRSSTTSVSQSATRSSRRLKLGKVHVQASGRRVTLSRAARRTVLAIAQSYVDKAILAPLVTGKVGRGYAALFVPGIREAATGADKPVLTEVPVGRTKTFRERSSPVAVSALAGPSGDLIYLATTFHVNVHATRTSGAVTIDRKVELTYERAGRGLRVVAYRIRITRRAPARPKTTTTRAAGLHTTTTRKSHKGVKP